MDSNARIVELADKGDKVDAIAERLGVTRAHVLRVIAGTGLTAKQRGLLGYANAHPGELRSATRARGRRGIRYHHYTEEEQAAAFEEAQKDPLLSVHNARKAPARDWRTALARSLAANMRLQLRGAGLDPQERKRRYIKNLYEERVIARKYGLDRPIYKTGMRMIEAKRRKYGQEA